MPTSDVVAYTDKEGQVRFTEGYKGLAVRLKYVGWVETAMCILLVLNFLAFFAARETASSAADRAAEAVNGQELLAARGDTTRAVACATNVAIGAQLPAACHAPAVVELYDVNARQTVGSGSAFHRLLCRVAAAEGITDATCASGQ
jgi:hypothetical protein